MSLPSRFFGSLWCQSCLAGCSAHTHTHTQHNTQTQHTHKHNTRVTINQQQQLQTHKTSTISFIRSQGQHHKHMQTDVGGARLILKQEQQQQQTCSQRCCSCFNISFIHQSLTGIFQMHVLKWKMYCTNRMVKEIAPGKLIWPEYLLACGVLIWSIHISSCSLWSMEQPADKDRSILNCLWFSVHHKFEGLVLSAS